MRYPQKIFLGLYRRLRRMAKVILLGDGAGDHPTVTLDYQGHLVEIDERMASLCKLLWVLGLETFHCCQGGPGQELDKRAYISFTPESGKSFAKLMDLMSLEVFGSFNSSPPRSNESSKLSEEIRLGRNGWSLQQLAHKRIVFYFPSKDIDRIVTLLGRNQ